MKMELQPDRKEIIRYLGYRGVTPDEEVLREIEACVLELNRAVTPMPPVLGRLGIRLLITSSLFV